MAVMADLKMHMNRKVSYSPIAISMGIYTIRVIGDCNSNVSYELPEEAAQFLIDGTTDRSEWNLMYIITPREDFSEPEDTPVAGFEEGPVPYRIYKEAEGNYLWIRKDKDKNNCLIYRISKNWSIWELLFDYSGGRSPDYFAELAYILPYAVLNKRGILFHGVVMEWNTIGIIVCAHSGVGKTTHTGMWKESEGAHILNGDRALCFLEDNIWYTCGVPWNGSSMECLNRRTVLRVIVIIEQSEINQVLHLSKRQGVLELISLAFAPAWEPELMNHAFDLIDDITREISVLKLQCRPDMEAVALLKHEIERQEAYKKA